MDKGNPFGLLPFESKIGRGQEKKRKEKKKVLGGLGGVDAYRRGAQSSRPPEEFASCPKSPFSSMFSIRERGGSPNTPSRPVYIGGAPSPPSLSRYARRAA